MAEQSTCTLGSAGAVVIAWATHGSAFGVQPFVKLRLVELADASPQRVAQTSCLRCRAMYAAPTLEEKVPMGTGLPHMHSRAVAVIRFVMHSLLPTSEVGDVTRETILYRRESLHSIRATTEPDGWRNANGRDTT